MMQNNTPPPLTAALNCLCCRTVLLPANCFLCPITQATNKPLVSSFTFHARPTSSTSEIYKRTHEETTCHPAPIFQFLRAILAVLQQQIQSMSRGSRRLGSTVSRFAEKAYRTFTVAVNVLYALFATLGAGVGLVCLSTLSEICASELDICGRRPPLSVYPSS
jgi:hypothetical protein